MKKVCILLTVVTCLLTMTACVPETAELHCDYEGCDNVVSFVVKDGQNMDESWTVFCEECAKKIDIDMDE
jgi:hypothetical protein